MIVDGNYSLVKQKKTSTWTFFFNPLTVAGAPTITIENDENENDAWTEYRHLFENNRYTYLEPIDGQQLFTSTQQCQYKFKRIEFFGTVGR